MKKMPCNADVYWLCDIFGWRQELSLGLKVLRGMAVERFFEESFEIE